MKNICIFNNGKSKALVSLILLIATSTTFTYLFPIVENHFSGTLSQGILKVALYILPFSIFVFFSGKIENDKKSEKERIDPFFCAFVLLACVFFSVIFSLIFNGAKNDAMDKTAGGVVAVFVTSCIISPIAEELVFRKALLFSLAPCGEVFALSASSILFALFHSPTDMPNALFSGLLLGFCAQYTESVKMSLTVHFANNILAFCFSYFDFLKNAYAYIILFLILIVLSVFAKSRVKGFISFRPKTKLLGKERPDIFIYTVTVIFAVLLILERYVI